LGVNPVTPPPFFLGIYVSAYNSKAAVSEVNFVQALNAGNVSYLQTVVCGVKESTEYRCYVLGSGILWLFK